MNILSLGAGVQSSTLALMAAKGEIAPMPDAAIFADTGWEPRKVHEYLDWLEKQLPFPVYRVMHKDGLLAGLQGNGRVASVPFFTGNGGMAWRQCTMEYKVIPVQKKTRELLGYKPRQRIPEGSATMWIGISTDEAIRMKQSKVAWIKHTWPLIDIGMNRDDCIAWFDGKGFPRPPKSSCLGCPYHSDKHWVEMKTNNPDEWEHTVQMDKLIRRRSEKMVQEQFMHRSCKPLDQVDFSMLENQLDMFGNECEGMCGV